jgi:hypothetical protein
VSEREITKTPYRSSAEIQRSEQVPLEPIVYKPVGQSAFRLVTTTVVLTAYAALIAGMAWFGVGLGTAGAVFLAILVYVFARRRRAIHLVSEIDRAGGLLAAGRAAEAATVLDTIIARSGSQPLYKTLAIAARAHTFVVQGDLARGLTLFDDIEKSGWLHEGALKVWRGRVSTWGALAAALSTDLDRARRSAEAARALVPPERAGLLFTVECIIALRAGRPDEVLARIDTEWLDAEGAMTPHDSRVVRVLCAFALEHGSKRESSADDLAFTLAAIRPFRPGEFDYLGAAWKEMGAFLREHGLTRENALPG